MNNNKLITIIVLIGLFVILIGLGAKEYGPDILCNNRCDKLDMDLTKSFYAQDQYFCECNNDVQHRLVIPMRK